MRIGSTVVLFWFKDIKLPRFDLVLLSLPSIAYLCTENIENMSTQTSSENRNYWLLFLVSTFVMLLMLVFMNQWFWIALPFSLTFFVYALKVV